MLELIQNSTSSFGIKELETYQEELESEYPEKELKTKVKVVNGIHSCNILQLKTSLGNLPKRQRFLLDPLFKHLMNNKQIVFKDWCSY